MIYKDNEGQATKSKVRKSGWRTRGGEMRVEGMRKGEFEVKRRLVLETGGVRVVSKQLALNSLL